MNTLRWSRTSRRDLLRATASGLLLAPFVPLLDAERAARAQTAGAKIPKRLFFFYSSNGMTRERWLPTMNGAELVLSEILEPLAEHKKDLLVIDGLGYNVTAKGQKDGHYGGMNSALTGSPPKIVDVAKGESQATGISIDQHVANTIGAATKFKSIEAGIQVDTYSATVAALSYTGPLQPLMPENDPYKIFTRLFRDLPGGAAGGAKVDPTIEAQRLDRKSMIDYVAADLTALTPKLGAEEKRKLDAHLVALRDLERTLTAGPGVSATASCKAPQPGAPIDIRRNDNIPMLGRLAVDLLVMAMACDLVRVGTVQHGRAGAQHRHSWLGPEFLSDPDNGPNDATKGIHGLAHNETNPVSRAKLAKCHRWYAGEVAYVVSRLKAIAEGGGTMADNTLVVWMNEMGTGNHSLKNTPWTLVGSAGGFFKTGRVLSFAGQAHNKLLANICQGMGLPDSKFGDPDYGTGALAGLS